MVEGRGWGGPVGGWIGTPRPGFAGASLGSAGEAGPGSDSPEGGFPVTGWGRPDFASGAEGARIASGAAAGGCAGGPGA